MADKKDYYEVLGVTKNATDDEIKKARNKLAAKYQNPASKGDADALAKMKEINEAYDVLKDKDKRAQYDQFGHAAFSGSGYGQGGGTYTGNINMDDIFGHMGDMGGFGDIFEQFFNPGGGRSRQKRGPQKGADLRYDLQITFEEAAFGKEMTIKVPRMETCEECGGTGAKKGTKPDECPDCHGTGMRQTTTRTPFGTIANARPCERCHGTGQIVKNPCEHCHGRGKVQIRRDINLKIPRGIDEGQRLRIQGGGQAGERGGAPGDLFVYIVIKPHKIFTRNGTDVYCEIPITFVQAALGAKIDAPTIDGKVELTIPEGTQSGEVMRIRGKGIPVLRSESRGDEYVKIKVLTPKNLSARQKNLLREFENGTSDSKNNPEKKSFFDKLKDLFE